MTELDARRLVLLAVDIVTPQLADDVPIYLGAANCVHDYAWSAFNEWKRWGRGVYGAEPWSAQDLWRLVYARARIERSRANAQAPSVWRSR